MMLLFFAWLAQLCVFAIIAILGNAIKNTENTNDNEGENL